MSTEAHRQLFTGTAAYYSRFRSTYPPELFDLIAKTFALDGKGRLLDLGCGPGNVFLGLHQYFEEVVAVDINSEMLAEARLRAENLGVKNIVLLERPAEEIGPDLGSFRFVTMGRSFHWMQHDLVLRKVWEILEPDGGLALLGDDDPAIRPWWDYIVQGLVHRWRKRTRAAEFRHEPFEDLVGRAAFRDMQRGEISVSETWDLERILGRVYSHSSGKPELFEDNLQAFENDLRRVLLLLEPGGHFRRENAFNYLFAFKR